MPTFDIYWSTLAVFGIISFILYVFIMITIIRYRKKSEFKSSFFVLWVSLGVADCYMFLHSYFFMRLPLLAVFTDFFDTHKTGFVPVYALIAVHYIFWVQLIGNALFAINRYSALTNVTFYEQVKIAEYQAFSIS